MPAFAASLALFLFFGQQQLGLVSAQMAVLRALVQSNCLQWCYIPGCGDLDPRCVCQQVADGPETGRACAVRTCSEENAYLDLWAECLSRRVDLGVTALTTRRGVSRKSPRGFMHVLMYIQLHLHQRPMRVQLHHQQPGSPQLTLPTMRSQRQPMPASHQATLQTMGSPVRRLTPRRQRPASSQLQSRCPCSFLRHW